MNYSTSQLKRKKESGLKTGRCHPEPGSGLLLQALSAVKGSQITALSSFLQSSNLTAPSSGPRFTLSPRTELEKKCTLQSTEKFTLKPGRKGFSSLS